MSKFRTLLTDFWRIGSSPLRSFRLRQMKAAGNVPVFVLFYHRIASSHPNPWSMDFATFKQQIHFMQERFDLISMEEVQQRIESGANSRPAVSITFDDGYAENCEEALPFLIEEKVPVTYFVTTMHTSKQLPFQHDVDRDAPLAVNTIESLKALANAGIEIGAHTRTHPDMGAIKDPASIIDEVITATRDLESLLGQKINYFAFPFGQRDNMQPRIFELLKRHGIKGVCSAYGGWNSIGDDSFHIQRIHGDPCFSRMQNWLTFDPRIAKVDRYDYSSDHDQFDWEQWEGKQESFVNQKADDSEPLVDVEISDSTSTETQESMQGNG